MNPIWQLLYKLLTVIVLSSLAFGNCLLQANNCVLRPILTVTNTVWNTGETGDIYALSALKMSKFTN